VNVKLVDNLSFLATHLVPFFGEQGIFEIFRTKKLLQLLEILLVEVSRKFANLFFSLSGSNVVGTLSMTYQDELRARKKRLRVR
jgi:hypothetical protein